MCNHDHDVSDYWNFLTVCFLTLLVHSSQQGYNSFGITGNLLQNILCTDHDTGPWLQLHCYAVKKSTKINITLHDETWYFHGSSTIFSSVLFKIP